MRSVVPCWGRRDMWAVRPPWRQRGTRRRGCQGQLLPGHGWAERNSSRSKENCLMNNVIKQMMQEKAKWQTAEAGVFNLNICLLPLPSETIQVNHSYCLLRQQHWNCLILWLLLNDSWAKTPLLMQRGGLSDTSRFSEFGILCLQTDSGKDAMRGYGSESQEPRGPLAHWGAHCPHFPGLIYCVLKMRSWMRCLPTSLLPLDSRTWGFPGGPVVKNLPANAGDTDRIPDLGESHMPQSN